MFIEGLGACLFGVVIGWVTYRTLRRTYDGVKVSDLAAVVGAVGGGVVAGLFQEPLIFSWYAIGLAIGFFGYLVLGHTVFKSSTWLGGGS